MIKIFINTPYIKLSQFLKFSGIIENGSKSKEFLEKNNVIVDGILEKRRNRKLYDGSKILVDNKNYLIIKENNNNE
ncbi:MAG: RNA-binding S4 domain-containing protein [Malacoplasma sp.]|nr:RNA-binding S4 domain-containing protein [Malacoplasma sp.]MDE5841998.1 RNA-binding S4 domain-containing protein [Malacoplasma sp.]MDE6082585.1 RNA-binding S4 domain-containing protein [Malacoplasma sp.]MDE6563173.1 RNA-binding S4 domain-containing protein [Malacoplasma sp.]